MHLISLHYYFISFTSLASTNCLHCNLVAKNVLDAPDAEQIAERQSL